MKRPPLPSRCSTGIPGLDEILHGGLIRDRLYLLEGEPGAGKTTLALQYLLAGVAEGEKCLYVTLSETQDELVANAVSHGWTLDGIEFFELTSDQQVAGEDGGLTMFHPAEIELSETTRKVLEAVERTSPKRLVFDSLSELRLLAQDSLRYRRQILALKQYFHGRGCTVLLLDDRTAHGEDLQLQSIAHGVISMYHTAPAYGAALRQLKITKFRGSAFESGFQDIDIIRSGVQVYPRLVAADHGVEFERETVPSGVQRLDDLLGGGIERGTSTLLIGPAGSGKSTIALQYAAAAARRGGHAAMFMFEEGRNLLLSRARGLGIDVREGTGPGNIMIRQLDPGEVSPGHFISLVREAVERNGARVIVIDSLNGYLNAMPEERALMVQLHELLAFLNNCGVATFLVAAQTGMLGVTKATVDTSYLADAVVLLRMFEHAGAIKKAISVMKKRSGRHEESIRHIWFDGHGIHLSEPLMNLRGVLAGVPVEIEMPSTMPPAQRLPGG
ncbi:ATPase domain-containing protein [Ramlibacter humi]|uniref:non-specific serine/threonine protein kinase n=1 Tax=Ramlibacter humi TaxID=2530451 RepID=A0A4Z0BHU4_9BURK|nr:ATPase domain-containing protein [Ramlibacter humi]TFY98360.1 circadian clock protein KaiC [Ramlibacter humi]